MMTSPRVTLILPPVGDPRAPHLSLPALTGFLRARGVEVQQIDADLESLLHVLDQSRLVNALRGIRYSPAVFSTRQEFKQRCALWERATENVDRALACLRSSDSFYDPISFHSARNTIDVALDLVGSATASRPSYSLNPLIFNYGGYNLKQCSQLVDLCDHDDNFPFTDYVTVDLVGKLEAFRPNLVGISILNHQQLAAGLYIAKTLKQRGYRVVVGGTIFSKFLSEVQRTPTLFEHFADWIVLYEGETALLELANYQVYGGDLAKIPNLAYLKGETPTFTYTHVEDVRLLPPPDFHGLPLDDYLTPELVLPIYFGKGCYFNLCKFCDIPQINSISEKAYRIRSVAQICDDLSEISSRTGSTNFVVTDEAVSPPYCDRLADELKNRKLSTFNFTAYARLEKGFSEALWRKMARVGFKKIYFGLESGSQATIDHMNKRIKVREVPNLLRALNRVGIRYHIFAMIGLPEETETEARKTFDFFKANRSVIEAPGNTFEIHRFGLDLRTEYFDERVRYGVHVNADALDGDFIVSLDESDWEQSNGMPHARVGELLDEFYDRLREEYGRWHNYPGSFWPMSEEYSLLYCVRYQNEEFPFQTALQPTIDPAKTPYVTVGWDVVTQCLDGDVVLENKHARARVSSRVARLITGSVHSRQYVGSAADKSAVPKAAIQKLISNGLLAIRILSSQETDFIDVPEHNRKSWDLEVTDGNPCTVPVSENVIAAARRGEWEIRVTGSSPVPKAWLPEISGADVLCLAGGGGQQGPVLAAAGANVVVFDISPNQLGQDRLVAARDDLELETVEGDMQNLGRFPNGSFDLVVHPVANQFVRDSHCVWREVFRILRAGGCLISGFINPIDYALDRELYSDGILQLKYRLPYSGLTSISESERLRIFGAEAPIEFGHTLEDQIGGQLAAGFVIVGFFEDHRKNDLLNQYMATYFATKAVKPPLYSRIHMRGNI